MGYKNWVASPLDSHDMTAWRIIPVSKWLITMDSKSPKDRVIPIPNGLFMAYKWGMILTTYKSWDDPPIRGALLYQRRLVAKL